MMEDIFNNNSDSPDYIITNSSIKNLLRVTKIIIIVRINHYIYNRNPLTDNQSMKVLNNDP